MSNLVNQPNSHAQASATSGTFNFSSSFTASTSSSVSGTNINPQRSQLHYSKQINADNSGATVRTSSSRDGAPLQTETRRYDAPGGRQVQGGGETKRIEDVTDEADADEESYEEKMEGEYAKREGGA